MHGTKPGGVRVRVRVHEDNGLSHSWGKGENRWRVVTAEAEEAGGGAGRRGGGGAGRSPTELQWILQLIWRQASNVHFVAPP